MKTKTTLVLAVTAIWMQSVFAQGSGLEKDEILGIWITGSKKAKVEIYKRRDEYWGRIVWLRDPYNDDGSEKLDKNNPDLALRLRKLMGTDILKEFEYDEDYEWDDGEIYDPDNGKTYSCVMNLREDKTTLEVRGYIGISLIGRTELWLRTTLD